jgi:hypothetical protein
VARAEGEEERRRTGAANIAATRDRAKQRKRKGGRKEKRGLTGGTRVSATKRKKEKRWETWAAAGRVKRAGRPKGR